MTTETEAKFLTIQEFKQLEWPDDDANDYELIGGRVFPRPAKISAKQGNIASKVSTALSNFAGDFAGEKQTGKVFVGASTNLGNPQGKNFPKPDVCFVLLDRLPPEYDEIPVAPAIVVEVNSPSDTDERRVEKLQAYRQAGVPLIWSIHMLEQFVLVYQIDKPYPSLLTPLDELDGGKILPGFRIKVSDLFK